MFDASRPTTRQRRKWLAGVLNMNDMRLWQPGVLKLTHKRVCIHVLKFELAEGVYHEHDFSPERIAKEECLAEEAAEEEAAAAAEDERLAHERIAKEERLAEEAAEEEAAAAAEEERLAREEEQETYSFTTDELAEISLWGEQRAKEMRDRRAVYPGR